MLVDAPADHPKVPFVDVSLLASGAARRSTADLPVVTRVTTGRTWQHCPDKQTDGAHVGGRSNTWWTDSNTLPRLRVISHGKLSKGRSGHEFDVASFADVDQRRRGPSQISP
jgi:hypothetical protein